MPPGCERAETRREDPTSASQIHALACLFQLLHAFINAANAFSPVVYKTIVFMLIEHMRNDPVRDFISAELKVALDTHHNIPVGILVDPIVKQASPAVNTRPATRRLRAHRVHVRTRPTRGATGAISSRSAFAPPSTTPRG